MYLADTYKIEQLLNRYNITMSTAIQIKDNKIKYYHGFKTMEVPVLNTKERKYKEYTLNKICQAVIKGKKIFPFYSTSKTVGICSTGTNYYEYAMKKGIVYDNYMIFLTQDLKLGFVTEAGDLYLYPVTFVGEINFVHLDKESILIKQMLGGLTSDFSITISEITADENYFGTVKTYDLKDIENFITAKLGLLGMLK